MIYWTTLNNRWKQCCTGCSVQNSRWFWSILFILEYERIDRALNSNSLYYDTNSVVHQSCQKWLFYPRSGLVCNKLSLLLKFLFCCWRPRCVQLLFIWQAVLKNLFKRQWKQVEIALLYNSFTTDNNTLVNLFVLVVARKLDFIHLKIKGQHFQRGSVG